MGRPPHRSIILAFALLAAPQAKAEPCPLEGQAHLPYADAGCQFYLGTTAYRAKAYEIAAAHWKRVVAAADDSDAGQAYESMAQSNPDAENLDDDDRAIYEDALSGIAELEADLDEAAIKEAEARAADLP